MTAGRVAAEEGGQAARTAECPKCKGVAPLIVPLKKVDKRRAVYGCPACGHSFNSSGAAFLKDAGELRDVFRGATLAHGTITEALAGEHLNPATRAILTAQLLEYGVQMYFDGLKQGLLLGTISQEKTHAAASAGSGARDSASEKGAGRDAPDSFVSDERGS